jgi:hypothetical protein
VPNDRGEHLKPPTNTPPERGLRTFSAARRQLGRALAGPLTALGDRLRGAPASDASKAAARSKYRLQQVLSTDRARVVEPASPAPIATPSSVERANPALAGKRASLPAGIAGSRVESDPKDPWLALAGSTVGSPTPARASTLDEDLAALASEVVSATMPRPPEAGPRNGASRSVPPPLPLKASSAPSNGTAKALPPPPPLRTSATAPAGFAQTAPAAPAPHVEELPAEELLLEELLDPAAVKTAPAGPETPADTAPGAGPTQARSSKVVAPSAAEPHPEDAPTEEPIRTRSMARLLASQGHHKRALWIYDWLLATNAADDTLRSEAEALRSTAGA